MTDAADEHRDLLEEIAASDLSISRYADLLLEDVEREAPLEV